MLNNNEYVIHTFTDILRILHREPAWRDELRAILLGDKLMELPDKFEEFRQKEFAPLKTKVDHIEKDVEILKQDVAILKQDVKILKEDVAILKQDVAILKQDVAILKQDVASLKNDVADLKGDNFERKVREQAPSYFGKMIRKCKVLSPIEFANLLDEALDNETISDKEREEALRADVVVTGVLKEDRTKDVVIVAEVSIKADRIDVDRAYERALVAQKALGVPAIAIVIGKELTEGAKQRAKELGVITA